MKRLTTEQWILRAKNTHGDLFNYSKSIYVTSKTPITIICNTHGEFTNWPSDHINGSKCPECSGTKRWTTEQFIERAKIIHGDFYNYDNSTYTGVYKKTTIGCPIHGPFEQTPGDHVNKQAGCQKCAKIGRDKTETKTTGQFIADAIKIHGNKYTYEEVQYVHSHLKVNITCTTHGIFAQAPNDHTNNGTGCPKCAHMLRPKNTSIGEQQVADFITNLGVDVVQNDRQRIYPKELDVVVPSHNVAIEYCGLYWHSEQQGKHHKYHKTKHDMCKEQGIQLLTVFEDEWNNKRDIVQRKIKHILHKSTSNKIYARKTKVITVDRKCKQEFFERHHIQGNGPSSINIGLLDGDTLVACMGLFKQNGNYVLNRYATSCRVVGGFSKLLAYFQKRYDWNTIISFADCRWSDGSLYTQCGWTLDSILPPDYCYATNSKGRTHKFNYRRKYLPKLLHKFDPSLSEKKNCDNNGILRIWDCGKLRFVMNNT